MNSGDTAWILMSTGLVMLMTPGLAFFYGGLVRTKNVLSTIMHSWFILALVSVTWVVFGYSLAFGPSQAGLIGGLDHLFLRGVGVEPGAYATTIPSMLFVVYQMMFAVITPALITGAFAERKSFNAFVVFAFLWSTLVYLPLCHWVWNTDGWLFKLGALDFAGGLVVHISSGVAALVAALYLGKRIRAESERFEPHNVTYVVLGGALLWFGWFGFNAGSAWAANGLAVNALLVTNTAAAAASLTWLFIGWLHKGAPSVVGAVSGAVAGLVAITPASGYVDVSGALAIGLAAGSVCYGAILLRERLQVDDALDVWAVHGVGGTLGAVLTGVFASTAVNPVVNGGGLLESGNPQLLVNQVIAVGATWVFSGAMTLAILKVVDLVFKVRVGSDVEIAGLDLALHGEVAYQQA
ncbi:MAG TPA: ammonium transporter [Candidatus Nanopelagicales bacterium]|nr:ammonium transporter [Candidatus Nanopelagicales bacterium]